MKILLFTLKLFQTSMNSFLLPNTKDDILKNVVDKPHWLPYIFSLLWKSMGSISCLVPTFFLKYLVCVFGRRQTQVWNNLRVSK